MSVSPSSSSSSAASSLVCAPDLAQPTDVVTAIDTVSTAGITDTVVDGSSIIPTPAIPTAPNVGENTHVGDILGEVCHDVPSAPDMDDIFGSSIPEAPPLDLFDDGVPLPPPDLDDIFAGDAKETVKKPATSTVATRNALKKFHWSKLDYSNTANTVWSSLQLEEDGDLMLDVQLMSTAFASKPASKVEAKKQEGSSQVGAASSSTHSVTSGGGAKPLIKHFIDGKRAQQMEIAMTSVRISAAQLREAVLSLDNTVPPSLVETMIKCAPNTQEMKQIIAFAAEQEGNENDFERKKGKNDAVVTKLALCDTLFLSLKDVPDLAGRLNMWMFRNHTFSPLMDSIKLKVSLIQNACNQLRTSTSLRSLLKVVLRFGNFLNHDKAQGFHISSLTKLGSTKSANDDVGSLLHYLVTYVHQNMSQCASFGGEIDQVKASAKVDTAWIDKEMKHIQANLRSLTVLLSKGSSTSTSSPDKSRFRPLMTTFCTDANKSYQQLREQYALTVLQVDETMKYFGYSSASASGSSAASWSEFFGIFDTFTSQFEAAEKELAFNKQKRDAADKRRNAMAAKKQPQAVHTLSTTTHSAQPLKTSAHSAATHAVQPLKTNTLQSHRRTNSNKSFSSPPSSLAKNDTKRTEKENVVA